MFLSAAAKEAEKTLKTIDVAAAAEAGFKVKETGAVKV